MKHLKHASETLAKKHLKTIANIGNIQIKHLQHTFENTDETLGTDLCNISVQPLQHMQHLDLLLQHPSVTILINTIPEIIPVCTLV
jgi:hypothetical protein